MTIFTHKCFMEIVLLQDPFENRPWCAYSLEFETVNEKKILQKILKYNKFIYRMAECLKTYLTRIGVLIHIFLM